MAEADGLDSETDADASVVVVDCEADADEGAVDGEADADADEGVVDDEAAADAGVDTVEGDFFTAKKRMDFSGFILPVLSNAVSILFNV